MVIIFSQKPLSSPVVEFGLFRFERNKINEACPNFTTGQAPKCDIINPV